MIRFFLSSFLVSLILTNGFADTIRVPADHSGITAALAAAREGDRIVVSAGNYRGRLRLKPGVTLVSEGGSEAGKNGLLRAERTIIDGGGGHEKEPGVSMAEGSVLDGFTVTGVGVFDAALLQKHWDEQGAGQRHDDIGGFKIPAVGADGVSCRIVNCIVRDNGDTGIALRGSRGGTALVIATHNHCFHNMGAGIGIMDGAEGIVRDNVCRRNFFAGIGMSGATSALVMNNECCDNVRAGIGISAGACPVVRGNRCYANRRAGIGIRTGAETRPVVEHNRCTENAMAGIGVEEGAQPVLRMNLCEANRLAGIGAADGARIIAADNELRRNEASGIGLSGDSAGILWRNVCGENALVAIGLPEKARAIIADNTLSREGGSPPLLAVRGQSSAIVAANQLRGGGVAGILIEGHAILQGNTLSGTGAQGIWLWKGAFAMAADNEVQGFKTPAKVTDGAVWQEKPR